MEDLVQAFDERLQEIEVYLDLLQVLEIQVQNGPPRIGEHGPRITVQQQRILYSSVYLQLYNLVESTVTRCVEAVSMAIVEKGPWQPADLSDKLRREWVRCIARTHVDLTYENRLAFALILCDHLAQTLPVSIFSVEKGGGGNWDDKTIEDMSERLGLSLRVSPEALTGIKRPFRNEQRPLEFIKVLRNNLAHGSLSFVECGENVTVQDLSDLKDRTATYLRDVVASFKASIDAYEFLLPTKRPNG